MTVHYKKNAGSRGGNLTGPDGHFSREYCIKKGPQKAREFFVFGEF
jgi:hypothetical protein